MAVERGFLRSETSLIQTIGRVPRNVDGKVILYADNVTGSMERAMAETSRRREKQAQFNLENNITPESIKKNIGDILGSVYERDHVRADISGFAEQGAMIGANLKTHMEHLEKQMRLAATDLDFETAARLRDEIKRLRETELAIADDPMAWEMEMRPSRRGQAPSPQDEGRRSLFRKNTLDEMTVGRTEVPIGGPMPQRPHPEGAPLGAVSKDGGPVRRERAGRGRMRMRGMRSGRSAGRGRRGGRGGD